MIDCSSESAWPTSWRIRSSVPASFAIASPVVGVVVDLVDGSGIEPSVTERPDGIRVLRVDTQVSLVEVQVATVALDDHRVVPALRLFLVAGGAGYAAEEGDARQRLGPGVDINLLRLPRDVLHDRDIVARHITVGVPFEESAG